MNYNYDKDLIASFLNPRKKPPLGIKPRKLVAESRVIDIAEGIIRFVQDGIPPKREWIIELAELSDYLNDEYTPEK